MIVSGFKEPVVTKKESELLANAMPNVKKLAFLDCDHMLPTEAPDALSKIILDFLKSYQ